MAEMGFVWKLRGDCVTEQERFKASPVSFFDESGEERKRWGGGVYVTTTFLSLHGVELHA